MRSGLPLPDRIQNAPSILPGLELYYKGFLDLNTSRAFTGFGIGPIGWLVIEQYCNVMELEQEQREDMHHHIAALDAVYMKHMQKKNS